MLCLHTPELLSTPSLLVSGLSLGLLNEGLRVGAPEGEAGAPFVGLSASAACPAPPEPDQLPLGTELFYLKCSEAGDQRPV